MADIWFGKYLMMTLPIVLLVICFMIIEWAETNKQIDYIEDNQLSDLSLSLSIRDLESTVHLDFVTNSTSKLFEDGSRLEIYRRNAVSNTVQTA
jgi:biopolymer transport protein ExbB/TolQ